MTDIEEQSIGQWMRSFKCDTEKYVQTEIDCVKQYQNDLPQRITKWKQEKIIDKANLNQRHISLCLSSLGIAVLTFKYQPGFLKVFRNTVFGYMGLGVILTPEIVNPYLAFRFIEYIEQK